MPLEARFGSHALTVLEDGSCRPRCFHFALIWGGPLEFPEPKTIHSRLSSPPNKTKKTAKILTLMRILLTSAESLVFVCVFVCLFGVFCCCLVLCVSFDFLFWFPRQVTLQTTLTSRRGLSFGALGCRAFLGKITPLSMLLLCRSAYKHSGCL